MREPKNVAKIPTRTYDATRPTDLSLEPLIEDIRAAHRLEIPFKVTTIHRRGYRNGGNVVKADLYEYRIEFELTEAEA